MNQEQNNLNTNNFNIQGSNGISNNQPLNNQSFNQGMGFNQQPIDSQLQPLPNYNQPIIQNPTSQPMNNFESVNVSNQSFNNRPPKKMNLGLIIGIVVILLLVIFIIIIGNKFFINNNDVINETIKETDSKLDYYPWVVNEFQIKYKLDENGDFLMMVDTGIYVSSNNEIVDYLVTDKKYMVAGKIINGSITIGDKVELIGYPYDTNEKIVTKIVKEIKIVSKSRFEDVYHTENKVLENTTIAKSGDTIALVLDNVTREDIVRGQVLAKPNYIRLHKKINANMHYYEINEGEFDTQAEYQCYFRNSDYSCDVVLLDNEKLFPGETSKINIYLKYTSTAVLIGDEFLIRRNGRSIAKGTVSEILE